MQWLEMEFVVEYFEDERWNRDTVFTDILLAEQILNKCIVDMPESVSYTHLTLPTICSV